jgi:hypothetical protein
MAGPQKRRGSLVSGRRGSGWHRRRGIGGGRGHLLCAERRRGLAAQGPACAAENSRRPTRRFSPPTAGRQAAARVIRTPTGCGRARIMRWRNVRLTPAIEFGRVPVAFQNPPRVQPRLRPHRRGKFEIAPPGRMAGSRPLFRSGAAVNPLRQFLVPFPRGRYQVTELAYDPNHPDWFNVYGDEDRRPGELGSTGPAGA